MVRSGFLLITLWSFISSVSLAVTDDDLAKNFSAAQKLANQGKITQAINAYQALIKSHPLLPEAYNNLAALYLKQKNTKQAKFILEQGLYAHKGYGVLYESLTAINVAMAREAYSKALQIDVKPSEMSIASLSLDKNQLPRNKNTIVISKVEKTRVEKPVNTAAVKSQAVVKTPAKVEQKIVRAANPSGNIKRDVVNRGVSNRDLNNQRKPVKKPEAIETVLQAWSAAWSAQAVDMYLSFYHKQYRPNNGMSRNSWQQSRRYRLKKPNWIKISLSDFKVAKKSEKQAVVNFKQLYQSNSFRDVSDKQMVLIYTDNGWQIFREKSI